MKRWSRRECLSPWEVRKMNYLASKKERRGGLEGEFRQRGQETISKTTKVNWSRNGYSEEKGGGGKINLRGRQKRKACQ